MKHTMSLRNEPFNSIKEGSKVIEMRLYDEKRQKLKVNDFIEFTNIETSEKILVEIEDLYMFENFQELYSYFDKTLLGYVEKDIANASDMEKYYSKEDQSKYGVVGIKIRKLN